VGARLDRSHPNIVYKLGDARRMLYADASFDACVSALAIDVIPEVDQVVREMRRVTRVGGTQTFCTLARACAKTPGGCNSGMAA
jgi:ubiquinone/menaquinone biosynthesis C-methylase UbiE